VTGEQRRALKVARDARTRERLAEDNDPLFNESTSGATSAEKEGDMPRKTDSTKATPDPKPSQRKRRGPSGAKKGEMAATPTVAVPEAPNGDALTEALMTGVREKVEGVERVDAKSGAYFRLRVGKATLGYVNPSKKGLILDLATPRSKVPSGVEVKDGPTGSLPVKFRVASEADVATAVGLIAAAVPSEEKEEAATA
jgi:hypothetical protein